MYDAKVMYPFLLHVYFYLNPIKAPTKVTPIEDNDFFFGWLYQVMM
jgi:hypothetical protein